MMTCPPADPMLRGCLQRRRADAEEIRLIYAAASAWLAERLSAKSAKRHFSDPDLRKASAA